LQDALKNVKDDFNAKRTGRKAERKKSGKNEKQNRKSANGKR